MGENRTDLLAEFDRAVEGKSTIKELGVDMMILHYWQCDRMEIQMGDLAIIFYAAFIIFSHAGDVAAFRVLFFVRDWNEVFTL